MFLKKLKNSERGSITIFVLGTMLMITGVIFVSYFSMMNKSSAQTAQLNKIQEEYNQSDSMMDQVYEQNLSLKSEKIPASDYGAEVIGYTCANNSAVGSWKILYADDTNIYLIANDYIPYNYIPATSTGNKPNRINSTSAVYFTNVIGDYPTGTASISDRKIRALSNDYFTKGYTSTSNNMKSVAYILDTNVWQGYVGEYAEYAIGAPTIELLFKSCNEKHGTRYGATATSSVGYYLKDKNGEGKYDNLHFNASDGLGDSLYFISSQSKAQAMWIASPGGNNDNHLLSLNTSSYLTYAEYSDNLTGGGLRPVVCLKEGVQFTKNGDGSYTITGM